MSKKEFINKEELDIDSIVIEDIAAEDIENRELLAKGVRDIEETKTLETNAKAFETKASEKRTVDDVEVEDIEDALGTDRTFAARMRTLGEDTDEAEDRDDLEEVSSEEAGTKPKRQKSDVLRKIVMVIALGVFIFATYQLVVIFMEYKAGTDEYDSLAKYAQDNGQTPEVSAEYIEEADPLNPDFEKANVDWAGLKAENGEVCGWIQFESIAEINYPIVHGSAANGTGNDYYLKHTFRGVANSAGSIFVEEQNSPDFTDMNTIIYGHNMKNGSMFGLLRKYKESDFYAGNEFFWIYTPQGNYRYKIFSCYEPLADSETYTWWSAPCGEYTDYLKKVSSYSKYPTGVQAHPSDKIVTLSTCTSRGSNYRFVVHAKLVYSESVVGGAQ